MWESQHYTTRVYREGINTCEPVFKKLEAKKSETEALKRKGLNGVNDGAAKKRVKKAKAGVVATCSRPEISASDVVATVGVVEDVEDAVVGTESFS